MKKASKLYIADRSGDGAHTRWEGGPQPNVLKQVGQGTFPGEEQMLSSRLLLGNLRGCQQQ